MMGPVNWEMGQPQAIPIRMNIKTEPQDDHEAQPTMASQGQGLPPPSMQLVNQASGQLQQPVSSSIGSNINNVQVACVKWNRVPPVEKIRSYNPMPRHGHKAVAYNQYLIVFGGGNEGIFSEVMVFDTSRREWYKPQVQGDIPRGRAAFGMAIHEGQAKIVIFGGMIEHGYLSNDMYELSISKWIWKRLLCTGYPEDYYPCPRMGHSFTLIGNTIYVFGGLRNTNIAEPHKLLPEYLNDLPTFHMNTDSPDGIWRNQITFGLKPSPRESHSAVAYSSKDGGYNKLIIFGGMYGFRLGDLHVLDVDTFMWSKMETTSYSPLPRSLHSACLVGVRMYVFGGWLEMAPGELERIEPSGLVNGNSVNYQRWKVANDLTCLNVETMTWEAVNYANLEPPGTFVLPRARAGHSAAVVNNRIYIWSGRDGYNRRTFDAKESGMLQVCCEDMWYLDVAKPAAPTKLRMLNWNPGAKALRLTWDPVPGAESYIVQCMLK